jgi:tRNA (guanine-N7-)-methyltransferase
MKPFYVNLAPLLDHSIIARPADWPALFGNSNPIEVEIGFGNGEYLAELSTKHPGVNFIGFEEYCNRISRTLRKLSRTGYDNVRVMRLDARAGFERYILPKSLTKVHCLYPPPWPKKGDIKHRLFTTDFLKLVNSRLKDGGVFKIVTDYYPYIEWIQEQTEGIGFSVELKKIPATYNTKFEKKWAEGGQKEFYELFFTKTEHKDVPLKEDVPLQTYVIKAFNPDNFKMETYSHDGIAVSLRGMLYDPKKETALVHVIASEGPILQSIRVVIFREEKGWRINLAEGTMLMPTVAVAKALELIHQAALKSI